MSAEEDALGENIEPLFQLLMRMERSRETRNDAEKLHRQCCQEIEAFQGRSRELERSVPASDIDLARYAVVALLDELALNHEGALKEYWLPRLLQVRYLNENVAGEGFFERLASIRGNPKRAAVLRVYYLCLMFGFRGKYRLRGSELELLEIEEGLRAELERMHAIPKELTLSPSGRRPYERIADANKNQLVFSLAVGAAIVSVLLYLGLRLALSRDTDLLVERVTAMLGV